MVFKSGFIALIGRPNAGKSTLVNALVGQKVAIVSSKPQTTRNRVLGIVNRPAAETSGKSSVQALSGAQGVEENKALKTGVNGAQAAEDTNTGKTNVQDGAQVVLIDTPGLHHGTGALSRLMIDETRQAVEGVDILALIVDASTEFGAQDREALGWVRRFRGPVFLLLNKVDRMKKEILLPLIDFYQKEFNFAEIFPISALKGQQLGALMDSWISYLPEHEPYFSTDDFTDQPERFMAAEFIREKAIAFTREEVPHSVAVLVEDFEESDTLVRIRANIYVERDGQKQILIGKGGEMVKKIGTEARKELEKLLGVKIFLQLFVKVEPNWRQRSNLIRQLDWRRQMEGMVPEDSMPIQSEAGRAAYAEDESEFQDVGEDKEEIDEGEGKEQERAGETADKNDFNNDEESEGRR